MNCCSPSYYFTRTHWIDPIWISREGIKIKVNRKLHLDMTYFDLPQGTELSYDWYDEKGNKYTLVKEIGRELYIATSSLMFLK